MNTPSAKGNPKRARIKSIQSKLEQERKKENPNSDSINDYKEELHELQKPNLAGVQIRSKCKLAKKFETPNAFFFMAEKQRKKKKIINEVRVGKTIITEPVQVRESVKNFYVNLFSKPNFKPNVLKNF